MNFYVLRQWKYSPGCREGCMDYCMVRFYRDKPDVQNLKYGECQEVYVVHPGQTVHVSNSSFDSSCACGSGFSYSVEVLDEDDDEGFDDEDEDGFFYSFDDIVTAFAQENTDYLTFGWDI